MIKEGISSEIFIEQYKHTFAQSFFSNKKKICSLLSVLNARRKEIGCNCYLERLFLKRNVSGRHYFVVCLKWETKTNKQFRGKFKLCKKRVFCVILQRKTNYLTSLVFETETIQTVVQRRGVQTSPTKVSLKGRLPQKPQYNSIFSCEIGQLHGLICHGFINK